MSLVAGAWPIPPTFCYSVYSSSCVLKYYCNSTWILPEFSHNTSRVYTKNTWIQPESHPLSGINMQLQNIHLLLILFMFTGTLSEHIRQKVLVCMVTSLNQALRMHRASSSRCADRNSNLKKLLACTAAETGSCQVLSPCARPIENV